METRFSEITRKNFISSSFSLFFRRKGYGLDLIGPMERSKMVEDKHGGQRNGKKE
jgi:hypothetical protein